MVHGASFLLDRAEKMVCASFSILTTWGSAHICVHSCTKYMNLAVLQQCVSSTFLRHFKCHLASIYVSPQLLMQMLTFAAEKQAVATSVHPCVILSVTLRHFKCHLNF